jgi:putative hydrolase of the HAD superfamily
VTVLLLDLDGVLVHPSPTLQADLLAAADWRDGGPGPFLGALADDPGQLAALVGEADILAAMAPLLRTYAPGADAAAVHDAFCAAPVVDADLADLLPHLRVDAVHMVTNQDACRLAALSPVLAGLAVDGVFASCDLGARKPDAHFFEDVLSVLGSPAGHCLFVDDSPANVDGARAAGLDAVLHTSTARLRTELVARDLLDEQSLP